MNKTLRCLLLAGVSLSLLAGPVLPAFSQAFTNPTGGASVNVPATASAQSSSGDTLVSGGATAAVVSAAGTIYVPGQTITLNDGGSPPAVLTVATTKAVSATVVASNSDGTPGGTTCTGTTGTPTPFQFTSTINGSNNLTAAVMTLSVAGSYTTNPTNVAVEPVTCTGGITGVTLHVVMGAATATIKTAGTVTATPNNPVAQTSSSGSGTAATWTMTYAPVAQTLFGGAHPVNGWKVCNGNGSGDFWVTDNGTTPTANGPSSYRSVANGGACAGTVAGEWPLANSTIEVLGTTIGQKIIGRYW